METASKVASFVGTKDVLIIYSAWLLMRWIHEKKTQLTITQRAFKKYYLLNFKRTSRKIWAQRVIHLWLNHMRKEGADAVE